VMPSDKLQGEVPGHIYPILCDECHTGTQESVPITRSGPRVVDEAKRTFERLKIEGCK
jgi:hypothetical protein